MGSRKFPIYYSLYNIPLSSRLWIFFVLCFFFSFFSIYLSHSSRTSYPISSPQTIISRLLFLVFPSISLLSLQFLFHLSGIKSLSRYFSSFNNFIPTSTLYALAMPRSPTFLQFCKLSYHNLIVGNRIPTSVIKCTALTDLCVIYGPGFLPGYHRMSLQSYQLHTNSRLYIAPTTVLCYFSDFTAWYSGLSKHVLQERGGGSLLFLLFKILAKTRPLKLISLVPLQLHNQL